MILERVALELGVPLHFIESLARTASYEYKSYPIPKRQGGYREIHHPSRRLKGLQRWLLLNVVEQLPIHSAASAYRKHRSIFDNAKIHAPRRYLLRMDLENFFPSITEPDIRKYIETHATLFSGWTSSDVGSFCGLVCRHSSLTVGAPTSPMLSNALCYDLDVSLETLCDKAHVAYTRYADDLFFSTDQPNVLRQIETDVARAISELKIPAKLRLTVRGESLDSPMKFLA